MHDLFDLANGKFLQGLMINAMFLSGVISIAALLVTRWFIRSPAARALVLFLALTLCAALPLVQILPIAQQWRISVPVAFLPELSGPIGDWNASITGSPGAQPSTPLVPSELAPPSQYENGLHDFYSAVSPAEPGDAVFSTLSTDEMATPVNQSSVNRARSDGGFVNPRTFSFFARVACFGWLLVSLVLFLRLAASVFATIRLVRQSSICQNDGLMQMVTKASEKAGLYSVPRLLTNARIRTPVTIAFQNPCLLVPENFHRQAPKNIAAILDHEMAHVRRRDGWARLWVHAVTLSLPLQPLVWWMRRDYFRVVEEACDDWAVTHGCDPVDLAALLTDLGATNQRPVGLSLSIGQSATRTRVLRLLKMRVPSTAGLSLRWKVVVSLVMCIAGGTLASMRLEPGSNSPPPTMTGVRDSESSESFERELSSGTPESLVETTQQPVSPMSDASSDRQENPSFDLKINGNCLDEKGQPVAGATVRLFVIAEPVVNWYHPTWTEFGSETSNMDGSFSFLCPVAKRSPEETYCLIAQSSGRATFCRQIVRQDLSETGDSLRQSAVLNVLPSIPVEGLVKDQNGDPVKDAIVTIQSPFLNAPLLGVRAVRTDANGKFSVRDAGAFYTDNPRIATRTGMVHHPKHAYQQFLIGDTPSVIQVSLQPAAAVSGVVTLKESGQPAAGVRVTSESPNLGWDWSPVGTYTDEQGRYEITNLPLDKYRIRARFPNRPVALSTDVELKKGPNKHDIELELGGTIKGFVVNAETEKPIPMTDGLEMQISDVVSKSATTTTSVYVNQDGSFEIWFRLAVGI